MRGGRQLSRSSWSHDSSKVESEQKHESDTEDADGLEPIDRRQAVAESCVRIVHIHDEQY